MSRPHDRCRATAVVYRSCQILVPGRAGLVNLILLLLDDRSDTIVGIEDLSDLDINTPTLLRV